MSVVIGYEWNTFSFPARNKLSFIGYLKYLPGYWYHAGEIWL